MVGESAAGVDVGVIQLSPATTIRVAVELVGGPPLAPGDREPTVILRHNSEFGPRIVAERIGPEMVLRGISFEEGTWEVRLFTKGKMEEFTAPFHGQPGKRDQKFTLRLLRDSVAVQDANSVEGKIEVSESIVPLMSLTREFTIAGRVVGPDGTPIEGAFVSDFSLPPGRSMLQWVRTGPAGDFILKSSAGLAMPSVTYGDSDYWNLFFSEAQLAGNPGRRVGADSAHHHHAQRFPIIDWRVWSGRFER